MRLLAIVEAGSVTGPVKNLLQFAELSRPTVEVTVAAISRGPVSGALMEGAQKSDVPVEAVSERRLFDRSVIAGLRGAVEKSRPDILQTHAVKSHFLVRMGGLTRH